MSISVITPTIWASGELPRIVSMLEAVPEVSEVIIVDNRPNKAEELHSRKVKILKQRKNIYVNPAWNLAVKKANEQLLCFLCDDVVPKPEFFSFVSGIYAQDSGGSVGLVGLDWNNPCGELSAQPVGWRTSNWFGGVWFMKREDYSHIPLTKIWCGEDWNMVRMLNRGKTNYEVRGFSEHRLQESASIVALGGLRGRIGWVLRCDKYLWSLFMKPLLAVDRLFASATK